ncbi:MAG: histidine kinase [Caulobacteraceae bacterium]|nr:histidine kinase [Caulobacteraceae bacterium]
MSLSPVLETRSGGHATTPVRPSASPATASAVTTDAARLFSQPLAPLATVCSVLLLTVFSIQFGRSSDGIVVMWLANAVAVAVWLRTGRGASFDLCFGALMAVAVASGEILAGHTLANTVMLTVVNLFEMVAAVTLVRRFAPDISLQTVKSTVRLVALVAIAAPLIGAAAGAVVFSVMRGAPLFQSFQVWWFGHALAMMLVVPLILSINRHSFAIVKQPLRMLEWLVLLGLLFAVAYGRYFHGVTFVAFFLNMLMVVIAARLRMAGVTIAILGSCILMFMAMLHGHPGAETTVSAMQILNAQLMMISVVLPFMLAAALLTELDGLSARARAGQKRAELASEAKSRLLANVAHEIKSPVGGVIGIGELWSSGQLGPVTPTQKEMADMLVKTARQVEALAHDLLDVARAESGAVTVELRPTDVVGLVEDIRRATALRPEALNLRLEVVRDGDGLVALADSQRLSQVIDNLATNAVKYGASGGSVTFRVSRVFQGVRIEVADRGPGITPEKQTQLFEPFNRLGLERSTVEGHGIGLALAKRLIELQGGNIGVESVPGEGATFWIELPAA